MVFLSAMLFAQEVSQSEALTMAQNFMSAKASRSMFLKPVSFETKGLNHMYFFTDERDDKGFHKFIEKKTFFYPIKNKLLYL